MLQSESNGIQRFPVKADSTSETIKVALAFYHKGKLKKLASYSCFYFRALEGFTEEPDYIKKFSEANYVIFYSGGRSHEAKFNGYYGKIKSIRKRHKSEINGKEKSVIEYYYEVKVANKFVFNNNIKAIINPAVLIGSLKSTEMSLFQKYLPTFTTLNNVLRHNKIYML